MYVENTFQLCLVSRELGILTSYKLSYNVKICADLLFSDFSFCAVSFSWSSISFDVVVITDICWFILIEFSAFFSFNPAIVAFVPSISDFVKLVSSHLTCDEVIVGSVCTAVNKSVVMSEFFISGDCLLRLKGKNRKNLRLFILTKTLIFGFICFQNRWHTNVKILQNSRITEAITIIVMAIISIIKISDCF